MNRADFQKLAKIRLEEARTLLDHKKYDGAYYLAGYAVECGLKACIAKLTKQDDFPPERQFVEKCYTHDSEKLLVASELKKAKDEAVENDSALSTNWGIVQLWKESDRYQRKGNAEAQTLYDAITDPEHGVMQWIEQNW